MRKVMCSLLVVAALGVLALGQVEPRGIIIEPPDPEGLTVRVWTDKPVYQVDEFVQIHFEINKPAYIYIWDIRPDGEVIKIFPNVYDSQNYFRAGRHSIPTPGKTYNLRVEPPLGTEWLQILAVTQEFPVQLLGADPDRLEAQVLGLIPEPAEHAFDFTSFEIVDRRPPAPGTLRVRTTPSLVRIYVDGVFRGWSPRELQLAPGTYDVLLRRDGYEDHTARLLIQSGRTRTHTVSLTPLPVNRPPVARFTWTPEQPEPNQWVRFDAGDSYDPDGRIVRYEWDFNDDGRVDASGEVVFHRFARSGSYRVRLKMTDNDGATDELRRSVQVSLAAPPLPPGMPNMGTTPGIYVWGTDSWNVTVNGSPLWGSPRPYRIELRTDGTFVGVSTDTGAAPLGLVPEPTDEGWRLVFEGSVQTGRVTHTFRVRDASSIWMDLRLDMTGNGVPDRSPGLVRLRQLMVNPPFNPMVVGLPEGHPGPLVPSVNFRIGSSVSYTERVRFVFWSTSIGSLEAR